MNFKAMLRTLTISAFVFLSVAGAAGTAAVAQADAHPAACVVTPTNVCPDGDGGAGNG